MNEVVVNIYLLQRLKSSLETLFSPDNPFRQCLEANIDSMISDLMNDTEDE